MITELDGPKPAGYVADGLGHHLHLQPWLDVAVTSNTLLLTSKTGLATAIKWFVATPRETELQLIIAATILEHLDNCFQRNHGPSVVWEAAAIKGLKAELDRALPRIVDDTVPGRVASQVSERVGKALGDLNRASLAESLIRMLDFYHVPVDDIRSLIGPAIRARNQVIHRDDYRQEYAFEDLYGHVAVLREVLKRTFLALLEYRGQYHSMLNGPVWISFPTLAVSE